MNLYYLAQTKKRTLLALLAAACLSATTHSIAGLDPLAQIDAAPLGSVGATVETESYSLHGQFTNVTQKHPGFTSPYAGPNSLEASESAKETTDVTLYLGVRLWQGGELFLNPEMDQGYGLSNTLGLAGYSSGEAYKVGSWSPYFRMPRAFLRQTFELGGERTRVESGANTLASSKLENNVTLTLGKFSVGDLFDTNAYAHDPRVDFLNWAVIESGAFDYAADAWGYTTGAALEWNQGTWSTRVGYFALSTEPNGASIDTSFAQNSSVVEVERRFTLFKQPGKVKLLAYLNRGRMALYANAVALGQTTGTAPDVSLVRRNGSKSGFAFNLEQDIGSGVGVFLRLSNNDGKSEAFEFTEINSSAAAGMAVKGGHWDRPEDTLGATVAVNALSSDAQTYFRAGGIGILIGDGLLPNYGTEQIFEAYYAAHINRKLTVGVDLQYILNPAYNRDRGPVTIYSLRVHAEF